jgi:hypothetical protein
MFFSLLCVFWGWCIHIQIYFIASEMSESQHVMSQSWISLYNYYAKTWVSKNRPPCLDVEVILPSTCKWLKNTPKTCSLQKDRTRFYGMEGVQVLVPDTISMPQNDNSIYVKLIKLHSTITYSNPATCRLLDSCISCPSQRLVDAMASCCGLTASIS